MSSGCSGHARPVLKSRTSRRVRPRTRSGVPDSTTLPPTTDQPGLEPQLGLRRPAAGHRREGCPEQLELLARISHRQSPVQLVEAGPVTVERSVAALQTACCPLAQGAGIEVSLGRHVQLDGTVEERSCRGPRRVLEPRPFAEQRRMEQALAPLIVVQPVLADPDRSAGPRKDPGVHQSKLQSAPHAIGQRDVGRRKAAHADELLEGAPLGWSQVHRPDRTDRHRHERWESGPRPNRRGIDSIPTWSGRG